MDYLPQIMRLRIILGVALLALALLAQVLE
jgi:hypothetical protein